MTKLEKVIKGLECCKWEYENYAGYFPKDEIVGKNEIGNDKYKSVCEECPYHISQKMSSDCLEELHRDALELLKEDETQLQYRDEVIYEEKRETARLRKLLKEQEPQSWISVKDRLPEGRTNPHTLDFEFVLCATVFGDIRVYKYGQRLGQTEAHFYHGYSWMDDYVTHWMPLPEPPKEGDGE